MILPRFIRLRDAPIYLGVDRNRFNAEIRPALTEIPIGTQGVAFDRLDLDAWADDYVHRNGRAPGRKVQLLSALGCAVYGTYNGRDIFWIMWAPLPKKPKH